MGHLCLPDNQGPKLQESTKRKADAQRAIKCCKHPIWWGAFLGAGGDGRPVQRVEEWGTWASHTRELSEAGWGRLEGGGGAWGAKTGRPPPQALPRYANYWAPLTHKRHPPQPAQPWHTNHWALRSGNDASRLQRLTKRSNPTQHVKGRTGDCPGPRKKQQPNGMSHRGVRVMWHLFLLDRQLQNRGFPSFGPKTRL